MQYRRMPIALDCELRLCRPEVARAVAVSSVSVDELCNVYLERRESLPESRRADRGRTCARRSCACVLSASSAFVSTV